jgi:transposase
MVGSKRINNSYIESRNNQIEKLFFNANGFMNFKRTRNRILYCLNKKDTYKL